MLIQNLNKCTRLCSRHTVKYWPCLIGSRTVATAQSQRYLLITNKCNFITKVRNFKTLHKEGKGLQTKMQRQAELVIVPLRGAATNAKKARIKLKGQDVLRLVSLAKSEKLVLTAAVGCLLISSAITMSVPFAMGKILDIIFNNDSAQQGTTQSKLTEFCLILSGVFLLGGLANFGRVYLFNSASLRIVRDLRSKLYQRILSQETAWFDTKGSGELLNRIVNDTYMVGNSLSQNLSDGLRSTVMILAGTSMMIFTSAKLALVSTCVVPVVAGIAILYGRYVRQITRQLLDKFAEISKAIEERFANIKTVKSFSKESQEHKAYDNMLLEALQIGYKEIMAKALFFGMTGLSGNIIIISVLFYGGTLVVSESLTIGALTSFILYAAYTGISINGLSNFYTDLNKGIGAAQRIWEIMDRPYAMPINTGLTPVQPPIGAVKFQNIAFNYPARPDGIVLRNFNLTLQPGETTAVVGRSGSGKSTIAALLLRLYDPKEGAITLDGMNLKDLNPIWLRNYIGAVSQEPVLFSGSIRDNILYGLNEHASISDEALNEIIRRTHIDEFVTQLPDGLNTLVGQRGVMLSGGQKQRVAIARALVKNPTILILDEATSALDSMSEELVQNALQQLSKGRTVLTIAHRLSTIRDAHQIAVLDNGQIIELGNYDNLMRQDTGAFKELVRKQAFMSN